MFLVFTKLCLCNLPNFSDHAESFFEWRHEVVVDNVGNVKRHNVFKLSETKNKKLKFILSLGDNFFESRSEGQTQSAENIKTKAPKYSI